MHYSALLSMQAMPARGFTLVELVLILVLIGILSVAAYSRLDPNPIIAGGFAQEVRAAIRFAHKFALSSGCDVQVDINAASHSYALRLRSDANGAPSNCLSASGAFANPLNNPATGNAFSGTGPSGSVSGNLQFFFNAEGAPSSAGSITIGGSLLTIEAGTGLVY